MSQELSASFPYSHQPGNPYIDGLVEGDNLGTSVFLPPPGDLTAPQIPYDKRGTICGDPYIGDTPCIDTNTIHHTVFTGSF